MGRQDASSSPSPDEGPSIAKLMGGVAAVIALGLWLWLFGPPSIWAAIYGTDSMGFMEFAYQTCEIRERLQREDATRCYHRYRDAQDRYRHGP